MKFTQTLLTICFALIFSVTSPLSAPAQAKSDQNTARPPAIKDGRASSQSAALPSRSISRKLKSGWAINSRRAQLSQVTEGQGKQPSFGVLWFNARTEIDKVNRLVTFSNFKVTRLNFPSTPYRAAAYESALQTRVSEKAEVIALDRLLADMAANQTAKSERRPRSQE